MLRPLSIHLTEEISPAETSSSRHGDEEGAQLAPNAQTTQSAPRGSSEPTQKRESRRQTEGYIPFKRVRLNGSGKVESPYHARESREPLDIPREAGEHAGVGQSQLNQISGSNFGLRIGRW